MDRRSFLRRLAVTAMAVPFAAPPVVSLLELASRKPRSHGTGRATLWFQAIDPVTGMLTGECHELGVITDIRFSEHGAIESHGEVISFRDPPVLSGTVEFHMPEWTPEFTMICLGLTPEIPS